MFEQLRRDREGTHDARHAGGLGRADGSDRARGGSATPARSPCSGRVFNAVVRADPVAASAAPADDFELVEAESRTEAATALLLDLSFSMPLRGHWVPAKRMALALHALIEGRYPHDTLYLIGFSDYARRMQPEDLAATGWERVYGTNMQHAFNLAGRLLAAASARDQAGHHGHRRRADGAPGGRGTGSSPGRPVPETIRRTLPEAMRLARRGRDDQRVHAGGLRPGCRGSWSDWRASPMGGCSRPRARDWASS